MAEKLAGEGSALISAIMLIGEEGNLNGRSESIIASAGYAVINDGKQAGYINRNTARGVNLLISQVGSDLTEVPDGVGGYAAL